MPEQPEGAFVADPAAVDRSPNIVNGKRRVQRDAAGRARIARDQEVGADRRGRVGPRLHLLRMRSDASRQEAESGNGNRRCRDKASGGWRPYAPGTGSFRHMAAAVHGLIHIPAAMSSTVRRASSRLSTGAELPHPRGELLRPRLESVIDIEPAILRGADAPSWQPQPIADLVLDHPASALDPGAGERADFAGEPEFLVLVAGRLDLLPVAIRLHGALDRFGPGEIIADESDDQLSLARHHRRPDADIHQPGDRRDIGVIGGDHLDLALP